MNALSTQKEGITLSWINPQLTGSFVTYTLEGYRAVARQFDYPYLPSDLFAVIDNTLYFEFFDSCHSLLLDTWSIYRYGRLIEELTDDEVDDIDNDACSYHHEVLAQIMESISEVNHIYRLFYLKFETFGDDLRKPVLDDVAFEVVNSPLKEVW